MTDPVADAHVDARARVESWIADRANVSTSQAAAAAHQGDFHLAACPGAGKTRTVGVRMAWNAVTPKVVDGVPRRRRTAAVSYTNVAIEEITAAAETAGCTISGPDYIGTIHAFMLRYVVRPFASGVMGCAASPTLVVDTRSREETVRFREGFVWREVSIWDLHFRADGTLVVGAGADVLFQTKLSPAQIAHAVQGDARAMKVELARQGLMSMSDAMYWAQKSLEQTRNAWALATRFDELIVDEAQDTSDTQIKCLELLKAAGLNSLVLVGDVDQAIYGFAGAEPDALDGLIDRSGLERLALTENWRSSQRICDVAARFRAGTDPDQAVGPTSEAPHPPELLVYPDGDLRAAVQLFEERLKVHAVPDDARVVVLCRNGNTRDEINGTGGGIFKGRLAELAELAAVVQHGHQIGRDVIAEIESDISWHAWPELLEDESSERRLRLRTAVFALAERLPSLDLASTQWCSETRDAVRATVNALADEAGGTPKRFNAQAPKGTGAYAVNDLLSGRTHTIRARTVHSVKGESYDATLTVAIENDTFNNARDWLHTDGEERRIAFVALTRARLYGAIAVPSCCATDLMTAVEAVGFKRPTEYRA